MTHFEGRENYGYVETKQMSLLWVITNAVLLVHFTATPRSIWMVGAFTIHIVRKASKSIFIRKKRCVVWTSEQGVMDVLVEAAYAIKGMREN